MMFKRWLSVAIILAGCGLEPGIAEYNEGVELMAAGKVELAEAAFKKAIAEKPDLAEAHLNLGKIYMDKGWLEGAKTSTERAIDLFEGGPVPDSPISDGGASLSIAYTNLGMVKLATFKAKMEKYGGWAILALNGKIDEVDDVVMCLEHAIKVDPSNSTAQAELQEIKNNPYLWSEKWSAERRKKLAATATDAGEME